MLLSRLFSVLQGVLLLQSHPSLRCVPQDLAVAQVKRDLELLSSSEDEQNNWDPTGKSIEEIRAFLEKWERACRNSNYFRIAKNYAEYKLDTTRTFKRKFAKLKVRRRKQGNCMQENVFQVL